MEERARGKKAAQPQWTGARLRSVVFGPGQTGAENIASSFSRQPARLGLGSATGHLGTVGTLWPVPPPSWHRVPLPVQQGAQLLALRAQSHMDTFMGSVGVKGPSPDSDWEMRASAGRAVEAEQWRGCLLLLLYSSKRGIGVNTVSPI